MLRKSVNISIIAALVAIVALTATSAIAQDSPKLVAPEKIKDIGEVSQGVKVEVDFELHNEGDAALVVKAVRPTCGCTVADFDREIAAGGKGFVRATLDTQDFSGPISKSILVTTNDPLTGAVNLIIKADVRPFVEILPRPMLTFNALQKEGATQKVIVVPVEAAGDFEITKVEHSPELFDVSFRKLSGDELLKGRGSEQYEVQVALADEAPLGPIKEEIILHTNKGGNRSVPVKVFGVVRPAIQVSPSQLQFGSVEAASGPGRYVIVATNRTGKRLEVSSATVNDEAFEAEIVTVESGRRYQVVVTVKKDATPGSRDARLVLKTNDPDHGEIEIPVRANIR